jgi:ribosomal protein S18 acetylase RimI-like enzyme
MPVGLSHLFAPFDPTAHGTPARGLAIITARPEHAPAIAAVQIDREGGSAAAIIPLIASELQMICQGTLPRYTALGLVDGAVVAYSRCGLFQREAPLPSGWYLCGVTVMRAWRRQGIGAALTAHRLDWLRSRTDTAYYTTAMENDASVAMHARFDFTELACGIPTPGSGRPGRLLAAALR